MPRVIGVDIPNNKVTYVALTSVYGIGQTTSMKILAHLGIDPMKRARDLTEEELSRLNKHIEDGELLVEGALRRQVSQNIQRLRDVKCYRGLRHRMNLPVRGQRTRSNARTRKGPKRTVAGKKSVKAKK